jgi:hypothetical protein
MSQRSSALVTCAVFGVLALSAAPASAQFYKEKTLTLLVNYGAGGNADTEARVYQHYLPKYIPGHPSVIIQNAPGAGGVTAINLLGLGIGAKPDGYTMSYFTISATDLIIDNPALKVPVVDFQIVAGARGWNIAYGRKDIQPGMTKPADIGKAKSIFAGGYSKTSSHDTRLRLSLEVLGVPYQMVTGFPATAAINKAMIQGEVNFSGSSLPGYQTQVIPQIINPGIGMPFWQYPVKGKDGTPVGNPDLLKAGIQIFDDVYKDAFGKAPSGPKYDALLMMNDIGTKLQRGMMFHKSAPKEAVEIMRKAVEDMSHDPGFRADYQRVTGQEPDLVGAAELEPLFERVRKLDPVIKKTLQDSVDK